MSVDPKTTIQVSTPNRDMLLELGSRMRERYPELWDRTPSFNAVIGYALTHLDDSDLRGDDGQER